MWAEDSFWRLFESEVVEEKSLVEDSCAVSTESELCRLGLLAFVAQNDIGYIV